MWGLPRRAIGPITLTVSLLTAAAGALAAGTGSATAGAAPAGPPPTARSGEALTEAEAVRLGLAEGAFIQIQEARVDLARSELVDAGVRANPSLDLGYESGEGVGDPSESTLRLSRTLDTSGRRALREQGAQQGLEATRREAEGERRDRAALVRSRFYAVLQEQERLAVLKSWDARVAQAAKVVGHRTGAGESSGYDLRRLDHERALARADRDEVAGRLAEAWHSLLALIDGGERGFAAVSGSLLPATPPPLEALAAGLDGRPDLRALRHREDAARFARQAAERTAVPDVTVGLGAKQISDRDGDGWGLVLGVSVPLPLFDRGQGAVSRADAESRVAAGEYRIALREAEARVRGLWEKAADLQRAASRLRDTGVPQARALAQTAQSSYQAGEIGVLELLDAHRSVKEAEMRALALALEARLATIELERISGGADR